MAKKKTPSKSVEALTHDEASRLNIPTAEHRSVLRESELSPVRVAYERRDRDLDPQLVWRGKDGKDWSDLVVHAPPLYIQEKVHPKALIDDLLRETKERAHEDGELTRDLFADFNGIPKGVDKTEFYQHDQNWTNRMILGDSLQVMASLAEREGLRGKVQCIYLDPPYGIKFNSNFQWSTTSRDVKDGKAEHITREPEQVKAFRDTWQDGIHSYLTYLRERLTVARDLLHESGSIFVQIGDENVHRVRAVLEEVFGEENFCSQIIVRKTSSLNSPVAKVNVLPASTDFILWFAKNIRAVKYRQLYSIKSLSSEGGDHYRLVEMPDGGVRSITKFEVFDSSQLPEEAKVFRLDNLISQGYSKTLSEPFIFENRQYSPGATSHWKTTLAGMARLALANRVSATGRSLAYRRRFSDFSAMMINTIWQDIGADSEKTYVVQTPTAAIKRCVLMTTDPGDLVLDPTCGSGTTAFVAEQWGRRWITTDTSRVSLALARARIMGARYPFYLLADSPAGQAKEAEITRNAPSSASTNGNISHGFVYQRVPHITLKSIANNAEIDVIWERFQEILEPLRKELNELLGTSWQEWEIPRELTEEIGTANGRVWTRINDKKSQAQKTKPSAEGSATTNIGVHSRPFAVHKQWWEQRIARQQEIDASIAAKADSEYLYDKPYEDKKRVRVAGPFTVESISPHRVLGVDENDELIDPQKNLADDAGEYAVRDFTQIILENLKTAGVQQANKQDHIQFNTLTAWPGDLVCAEGRYLEGNEESGVEKRAAIFIGPEFGTVSRPDLVEAAREAGDADFDVLIACAFNYEAHAAEFEKLGRIPVLKARMNADLHMADDLKNTGKGNLFVIFGEPDVDLLDTDDGRIQVRINGVDVFDPSSGDIRSDDTDGIACWFIDTDYNMESFFVRHAYFLGANDPYKSLKTTLKAEIDREAWESLHSDISRPFERPGSGRIAVKVINHLGDEVMKVFRV